jgi:TfuA protein
VKAPDPRSVLVFLGPSLPLARARQRLAADYRPPVKRGDLPERHGGTVVIVDGEFGQSLSVSPNEILRLLDAGTRVLGAASMGALRALELAPYGMRGAGWIFEAYRRGRIIADDEVAVTYAPGSFECLTVPLVNVRRWLEVLEGGGAVDAVTARRLLATAREFFYADRTEAALLEAWRARVGAQELRRLLAATGGRITDVKAADAELVLALARGAGAHPKGGPPWTVPPIPSPPSPSPPTPSRPIRRVPILNPR